METEKRAEGDEKRIMFKLDTDAGGSACYFCEQVVEPMGVDFFISAQSIEEAKKEVRVCLSCVKSKRPDLYQVFRDSYQMREEDRLHAFRNHTEEVRR
jgi:hypothetical protein